MTTFRALARPTITKKTVIKSAASAASAQGGCASSRLDHVFKFYRIRGGCASSRLISEFSDCVKDLRIFCYFLNGRATARQLDGRRKDRQTGGQTDGQAGGRADGRTAFRGSGTDPKAFAWQYRISVPNISHLVGFERFGKLQTSYC